MKKHILEFDVAITGISKNKAEQVLAEFQEIISKHVAGYNYKIYPEKEE